MAREKTSTIIIYSHPDCTYSSAAKDDYRSRGVKFDEIDVSLHPEAVPELERLTGGERITPVIVEGEEVIVGYHGVG